MSTVIINPKVFDAEAESDIELVQLHILTKEEDWKGVFDQIEVWRSTSMPQGPYEELTGPSWLPARVPSTAKDPATVVPTGPSVNLDGTQLQLRIDGELELSVTFSGPDPVTYQDAVTQVNAAGSGLFAAYLTEDADFVVHGLRPGNGATLEVFGADAAPILGLAIDPPENSGRGRDARLTLVVGKEAYNFTDLLGSKSYYYKTRFRNATNGAVSEFSQPFSVGQALGISSSNIVSGVLDLVGGDGRPAHNRMVQVYAPVQTTLVEEKLVTGGRQAKVTDVNGHVEFTLVRGTKYTVSINGTDIVREVVAPVDESVKIFNLLGAEIGTANDAFKVQVPNIVFAERRSL